MTDRYDHMNSTTRFIYRHIIRAKLKSAVISAAAIVFMLALGYFREAIIRTENEIDRLFETIPVAVEIMPSENRGAWVLDWHTMDDVISTATINNALNTGMLSNEHLEASYAWSLLVPEAEGGDFPGNWMEMIGYGESYGMVANAWNMDPLLATNDIGIFVSEHSRNSLDEIPGNAKELPDGTRIGYLEIEYADGYDDTSFEYFEDAPIPVIVSEDTLERRGMRIGDYGFISYSEIFLTGLDNGWRQATIIVIGSHNRNIVGYGTQDAVLLPLSALERMLNPYMGLTRAKFIVDASHTRDVDAVRSVLDDIVSYNNRIVRSGYALLDMEIKDEELFAVVKPLDKSLALLKQLYPVAIVLSVAVAFGLSLSVLLQCTKIAAIMRIQGFPKRNTQTALYAEHCALVLFGLLVSGLSLLMLGWGGGIAPVAASAGGYLAGAIVGSVSGSVVVTFRPPLELLQVRE